MAHFPWDIIILAVIALLMGAALFRVLGRKVGAQAARQEHRPMMSHAEGVERRTGGRGATQPPPLPGSAQREQTPTEYAVPDADTSVGRELLKLDAFVPAFQGERFLHQVEEIFGRVLNAFVQQERAALEPLVESDILAAFERAWEQRKADGHVLHGELKRIERLEIDGVSLPNHENIETCRVRVKVISWQVRYAKDVQGNIVDGTESLTEFCDLWGFSYVNNRWRLAETSVA